MGSLRFSRKVLYFGHRPLHSKRQFERIEPPLQRLVGPGRREVLAIHLGDQVELASLVGSIDPFVADVFHFGLRGGGRRVADRRPLAIGR